MHAFRRVAIATLVLLSAVASFAATGTILTTDGAPVAGAKISIRPHHTTVERIARLLSSGQREEPLLTVTTDSKGTFTYDAPKLATYEIDVEAPGFAPDSILLGNGDDFGAIALTAAPNRTGTITANGKPVANATVLWAGGNSRFLTTTDANGKYTAPDPTRWGQQVFVIHPDFAIARITYSNLGGDRPVLDQKVDAGVPLTGKVVTESGSPLANATVYLNDLPLTTSKDDGTFTIAHAPKSWDRISARLDDRGAVRAHTATGDLTIKVATLASVSGTVRDAKTSQPVAGVSVTANPATMRSLRNVVPQGAITDAKGNYTLLVEPGIYDIAATRPGYDIGTSNVNLGAAQRALKPFSLMPLARVSGTVVDEDKRPVAGARVAGRRASRGGDFAMMPMRRINNASSQQYSAPDGRFTTWTDGDADVEVEAAKKGFPSAKTSVMRIAAGDRKSGITLVIPRGVPVTGKVLDSKGKPIAGAVVATAESRGNDQGMIRRMTIGMTRASNDDDAVKTASDGTFSTRVKEGSWDFLFHRDGYSPKTLRAVTVATSMKPLEVTLDPSVEVSGRVTRGGVGVEGVNVTAIGESLSNATTGFDGSFRLENLGSGSLMLNLSKPDEFVQQMRSVTAPAKDVNIELPPGGRITGRVTDKANGRAVTSFQAGVAAARGGGGMVIMMPPALRAFTSDDGTFTLENVPAGTQQVVVSAPGYTTARMPSITVEEGKTVANLEVQLDTGVRLTGRVTGPDGAPLAGVSVQPNAMSGRVMRAGAMGADGSAITDADGTYTIEALERGEKTFEFQRNGYLAQSKTITLNDRETRLDVQLSSGQRVTGFVVNEANAPVPDASVRASSGGDGGFGGGSRTAHTDASGMFTLEGLAPGHYQFVASANGYADGLLTDFDIVSGGQPRVVLKTGGTITGHVTGLAEADLAGTTVTASGTGGNASAAVDPSGNYRIVGAPTGTVRVTARVNGGFSSGKISSPKSVQLDAGGSAQADLEFRTDTAVTGRVTRAGQPLAGVMVSFNPRGGTTQTTARTTTDSGGAYSITGLDDGSYSVTVFDANRSGVYSTTYDLKGSGTFDIDMKVATARGRVVDATSGEPISEARIEFRPVQSGTPMASHSGVSDSAGNFTVDSLTPGSYTVAADKQGYSNDLKDVVVSDSGAGDLVLKLSPIAGTTLRVVDARDGQLLNASVMVFDAQNRLVVPPDFRFGGAPQEVSLSLAPGSYRALVSVRGYASQRVAITAPSQQVVALTPGGSIAVSSKASTPRLAKLVGMDGLAVPTNVFDASGNVTIDPAPGITTIRNVAPGVYRLQIMNGQSVVASTTVTVTEGGIANVEL